MLSYAFLAVLVGGCATSGDLEELGAELKKNQEALKQELQEKHDESEQKIETAINLENVVLHMINIVTILKSNTQVSENVRRKSPIPKYVIVAPGT